MTAEPTRPLPAATLVPMRDGDDGLEVLLLRRSEQASFVPGRYVFPGGVVDAADASNEAASLVRRVSPAQAAARLDLRDADPPAIAYLVAAVRETFEESGLLVATSYEAGGAPSPTDAGLAAVRAELLEGRIGFVDVLTRLGAHVDGDGIAYFAHWITPERAPRRYDARFFAARIDCDIAAADIEAALDPREMNGALWTTPSAALRALEEEAIRMILPTRRTLEYLIAFADTGAALAAMERVVVATNLPRSEPDSNPS
jgi:8-oxo-dGTP pyrophosphatase MutT (NUDIX family)